MIVSDALLPAVETETGRDPQHAVIWLHGLGASGYDLLPLVPFLRLPDGLPVRFVFPHAPRMPVTINSGMVMPAWFDIRQVHLERRHDEAGIRRSAAQVGAVALYLALRHPEPLAGLAALSTYLVLEDTLAAERAVGNRGLAVFQAHGALDPMVDVALGRSTRDRLRALGHEVAWHEYTMRHEIREEEARDLGEWITARFG
ncbi:MAG: carboxylesterase [Planctomycetes bacterium]|nr:carboxylesterase [Planctomycetota bacterium]